MGKDTEYGMVTAEYAAQGLTHGIPGLRTDQFELVLVGDDEKWKCVRIPSEHLWELLRTPDFLSWQSFTWLFCCRRPMIYLGNWRDVVVDLNPENPRAFFESLLDPEDEAREWGPEAFESNSPSLFVFRCDSCAGHRAFYDNH